MLSAAALPAALALLSGVRASGDYPRRVSLSALIGAPDPAAGKSLPAPGAEAQLRFPNFFFCTKKAYRYNPDGFSTLYVGEKESTAAGEVKQDPGLAGFDASPAGPQVIYYVSINVSSVLDVTNADVLKELDTNAAELCSPWRPTTPNAPTQLLGAAVHATRRFEGIRYQSAAMLKEGRKDFCLVLFMDRLRPDSSVSVYDEAKVFNQVFWPSAYP